jgi:hypothetical protein
MGCSWLVSGYKRGFGFFRGECGADVVFFVADLVVKVVAALLFGERGPQRLIQGRDALDGVAVALRVSLRTIVVFGDR